MLKKNGVSIKDETIENKTGSKLTVRYQLEVKLNSDETKNELLVIMMNPSRATTKISDRTVNKVIKIACEEGYKKLIVLNSLPFYETKSQKLNKIIKSVEKSVRDEVLENNFKEIKNRVFNLNGYILLATGNPKIKITKIWMNKVYELLDGKEGYIYKKNEDGYYAHPLYQKNIKKINFEVPNT
ncbi:DUF1643 domain-containing protein [Carnobacterium maltaromaticum]|uniref:DUF1643 domain-containing protein n=1 Tax=Carnobacterium maltaromaticum TaxID=2751 RepID=UPI0039AEAE50